MEREVDNTMTMTIVREIEMVREIDFAMKESSYVVVRHGRKVEFLLYDLVEGSNGTVM